MNEYQELPCLFKNGKIVGSGVSYADYAKQPKGAKRGNLDYQLTRGDLVAFAHSPRKWLKVGSSRQATKAMRWGSLLDCLLLTPNQIADKIAVCPDELLSTDGHLRSKEAKAWKVSQGDKLVVTAEDLKEAQAVAVEIRAYPKVAELIDCSQTQVMVTAEYRDKETKIVVPFKVLFDLVPDANNLMFGKCLADAKQTTNASERAWVYKVRDEFYHVQSAVYEDCYRAALPDEDRTEWLHLVSEDSPPYETVIWPLSAEYRELGRMTALDALQRYCQCLATQIWPGYNDSIFNKFINPPNSLIS